MQIVHDASAAIRNPTPYITPYLGLRSRLSQAWLNRWTVLLFLVLVRTLLAIADLRDGLHDAQREAMSACTSLEHAGSAVASMPHYLAGGVNELTAHGIERAINGLMSMITMTVTGVEEIVIFVINLLTSTYVCLITLVVSGALHAAIQVTEDVAHFLNQTIGEIGTDIHHGIDDFQKGFNKFIDGINKIPKAFGSHDSIPELHVGNSLDRLDHLHLPGGLDQGLNKLNNSIPNFAQVNNFTNSAIRLPFEEIKKLINHALPTYHFNRSLFPVPEKQQMHFCNGDGTGHGDISSFFKGLLDIEITARRLAIIVLTLLALVAIIPMALKELYSWQSMRSRAELMQQHSYDPLDAVYIASRPLTSWAGLKAAEGFKSYRRKTLARWVIAYATTPTALFVLSLGLAGLLSAQCHYLVLTAVTKEAPDLAHQFGLFADRISDSMDNASLLWANETNAVILHTNQRINHDVFGWVNTSTSAMNNTLNTFSDEMIHALNVTFGGTVLYQPILEVYNCLIGLKVAGIEKGLTWVHDHAHIDFPLLPNDTFSLRKAAGGSGDKSAQDIMNKPGDDASGKVGAVLKRLFDKIEERIQQEAIVAACLLLLWLLLLLGGIIRALSLWFSSRHDDKLYHNAPFMAGMGAGLDGKTAPQHGGATGKNPFADPATDEKRASTASTLIHPEDHPPPPQPRQSAQHDSPTLPHVHDESTSYTTPTGAVITNNPTAWPMRPTNTSADHPANTFHNMPYTLKPRPMPSFSSGADTGGQSPTLRSPKDASAGGLYTHGQALSPVQERFGYAGQRVGEPQAGTARKSAAGVVYGGT